MREDAPRDGVICWSQPGADADEEEDRGKETWFKQKTEGEISLGLFPIRRGGQRPHLSCAVAPRNGAPLQSLGGQAELVSVQALSDSVRSGVPRHGGRTSEAGLLHITCTGGVLVGVVWWPAREKVDNKIGAGACAERRGRGGSLGIGSPPAQYFRCLWFSRVSRAHRQQQQEEANPSHAWASLGRLVAGSLGRGGRWSGLVVQHPCLRSSGAGTRGGKGSNLGKLPPAHT
ncbi:hypothetical protein KVR01_008419 [Diaporthe batatas]|uniref:uncharacterized protein n=1 Tax=Diaporthe batatas TaxID=748121 RepID=UPI001D05B9DC|nr:uncharacterized protein KVR01_008419 [Diaporthe batatas]KAG8161432.1 hypothetical protein KVR01_008419 [Diaporthe batatas]